MTLVAIEFILQRDRGNSSNQDSMKWGPLIDERDNSVVLNTMFVYSPTPKVRTLHYILRPLSSSQICPENLEANTYCAGSTVLARIGVALINLLSTVRTSPAWRTVTEVPSDAVVGT